MSATDVVSCATALLEHREPHRGTAGDGNDGTGDVLAASREAHARQQFVDGFYRAHAVLQIRESEDFSKGLELAMATQQAVVRQAVTMIEKRSITYVKRALLPQPPLVPF